MDQSTENEIQLIGSHQSEKLLYTQEDSHNIKTTWKHLPATSAARTVVTWTLGPRCHQQIVQVLNGSIVYFSGLDLYIDVINTG